MLGRACSLVLSALLIIGPVMQAAPAFASDGDGSASAEIPSSASVLAEASNVATVAASPDASPTVVRELVDKRTETAKQYLLSDGTIRAEIHQEPIHFQETGAGWTEINTDLVIGDGPGEFVSAATPSDVAFASQSATNAPVSIAADGYSIDFDLLNGLEAAKIVYGNRVRYLDVARDTDLEYQVLSDGVKETLVLGSAEAPTTFSFSMALNGLRVESDFSGGWGLYRPGSPVPEFRLSPLSVFDSSGAAGAEPAYCVDASMSVSVDDDRAVVTYVVSPEWCAAPDRVFPINIDPTLEKMPSGDAYVAKSYPTTNYGSNVNLNVGDTDGAGNINRSYVKFDVSSIPQGSFVLGAEFDVYLWHQYYPTGTRVTYLGKVTESWSESSVKWNGRPPWVSYLSQNVTGENKWVQWNVTSLAREWVSGQTPNYGLQMVQMDTENVGYHKRFCSSEDPYANARPRLCVDYTNPGTTGTTVDKTSYSVGDVVSGTIRVNSGFPYCLSTVYGAVNLLADDGVTNGDQARRRGFFRWSPNKPSSSWAAVPCSGTAGGWIAVGKGSSYGCDKIEPLLDQCVATMRYDPNDLGSNFFELDLKWRIKDDYGDMQNNDLDYDWVMADGSYSKTSGYKSLDNHFSVKPKPVTAVSVETTASGWRDSAAGDAGFAESRGSIAASWAPVPLADGYRVYLNDGSNFMRVGVVTDPSWSSAGAGVFPPDAETTTGWSSGNAFERASSPSASVRDQTMAVAGGGAGVLVADGDSLFVRAWGTSYPGPTKWRKFAMGGTGFTDMGEVGPSFATKRIVSGFALDHTIYNGYAVTESSIEGIAATSTSATTQTVLLTLSRPLVDRGTAADLTAASGNILVASDGSHIYNVAYNLTSGDHKDGYRIREYDAAGTWIADHDVAVDSSYIDGVFCANGRLYLMEWRGDSLVTTIDTSTWRMAGQWGGGWSSADTSEVAGCFDSARDRIITGSLGKGQVHVYPGPGLDLRDDPNALYRTTPGSEYDEAHYYMLKVVPYSEQGAPSLSTCATIPITLDNRTSNDVDDPKHSDVSLGLVAADSAFARLDSGELGLASADLRVASHGPPAQLSRSYLSGLGGATRFAPGWVFDFDRRLDVVEPTHPVYTDGNGQGHEFIRMSDGSYASPHGYHLKLWATNVGWFLVAADGSYLSFDTNGRLTHETDVSGQSTSYTYTTGAVVIHAANGRSITVSLDGEKVVQAVYATATGSREVDYDDRVSAQGDGQAVVTFNPGTADELCVLYTYLDGRLCGMSTTDDSLHAHSVSWGFAYADGRLTSIDAPAHGNGVGDRRTISYGERDSAVTTASIETTSQVRGVNRVVQTVFGMNPTGTLAYTSEPAEVGADGARTYMHYGYANDLVRTVSPGGVTESNAVNEDGQPLCSVDAGGGVTELRYDQGRLVWSMNPRDGTTTYRYCERDWVGADFFGPGPLREVITSTGSGDDARVRYEYDSSGRVTKKLTLINRTRTAGGSPYQDHWLEEYFEYNGSDTGRPTKLGLDEMVSAGGEIDYPTPSYANWSVALSETRTVSAIEVDLMYDEFGQLLTRTTPHADSESAHQLEFLGAEYSPAGRLLHSSNADGVVTGNRYDVLGRLLETSSTVEASSGVLVSGWSSSTVDPSGLTLRSEAMNASGTVDTWVENSYDPSGNRTHSVHSVVGDSWMWSDAAGRILSSWDPRARVTAPSEAADILLLSRRSTYDADGRLIASTQPGRDVAHSNVVTYDSAGRTIRQTESDGRWDATEWNAAGDVASTSKATEESTAPATTQYTYDLAGRVTKVRTDDGMVLKTTYDAGGRPIKTSAVQVYDGFESAFEDTATTFWFNELGWQLSRKDVNELAVTNGYSPAGDVETERSVDAGGVEISNVVSQWAPAVPGRLLSRTTSETGGAVTVNFAYDAFGRPTSEIHSRGGAVLRTIQASYDEFDRAVSSTDTASGVTSHFQYARGGTKRSDETVAYRSVVSTNSFDRWDREATSTASVALSSGDTVISRTAAWTATSSAPVAVSLRLGSGQEMVTSFTFDEADKVTSISGGAWGSGGVLASFNTSGTANKLTESVTLPWGGTRTRSFGYSPAGRITTVTVDGAGGATTATYSWCSTGTGELERVLEGSDA
ncbi:MAG: hypothetical protein CVT67_10760, partial [Actinobacteria bacterium HGW-Actinobacteria-7]